jgi:hypothetical protein
MIIVTDLFDNRARDTFCYCDFSHSTYQEHRHLGVLLPIFGPIEIPDSLSVAKITLRQIRGQTSYRSLGSQQDCRMETCK